MQKADTNAIPNSAHSTEFINGFEKCTWESSLLKTTEYSEELEEFIITFSNDARYKYKKFNKELYLDFLNSESKGNFFVSNIRNKYPKGENVEKL